MDKLHGLTHGFKTDLSKGIVNNADAALILMKQLGGIAKVGDIRRGLKEWRPGLHYTYLFNKSHFGGYGFVGKDFVTEKNTVYHSPYAASVEGHESQRRTYWYRHSHGVYALTAEGLKRLVELEALGK